MPLQDINIQGWTFGLEFECAMPAENAPAIGTYYHGVQIPELPEGWRAKSDGSISGFPRSWHTLEIVSPKLKGVDGLLQTKTVLEWAHRKNADVNKTCGTHIHLNWPTSMQSDDLKRVVHRVANSEKSLYAITGMKERERNMFTRPIKEAYRELRYDRDGLPLLNDGHEYRRRVLNMTNLSSGTKRTLEFRCFAGTLRFIKVCSYVCFVMGLLQKALATHQAKYDSNGGTTYDRTGYGKKRGPGESELCRVMYSLGWLKGRSTRLFGYIPEAANDEQKTQLPTVKEMYKELARLTQKYDSESV